MPSRSSRRQRGYPTASEIRESRQRAAEMMIPCMEPDRVDSLLTRLTPLRGYQELAEHSTDTNNNSSRSNPTNPQRSSNNTTPVCHFFAMNGSCRNGIHCAFSHDVIPGDTRSVPCAFFKKGNCRYGDACRFRHEEEPDETVCQPCNDDSAAPDNNDGNNNDDLVCGICMEHPTKFGLLSNCDHVFCFECLMEWRSSSTQATEKSLVKVCPICRKHSDYVLSSFSYAKTGDGKEDLMTAHKLRMGQIPCKRFNGDLGSCPFGRDCFYQHVDEYGNDLKYLDQSMQDIQEELERRKRRRLRHLESQRNIDAELQILEAHLALLQMGLAHFAFQLDI